MDYTVKLVKQDGAGGFDEVAVMTEPAFSAPITKVLNGIGAAGFEVSRYDLKHRPFYAALADDWLKSEVQIYRGDAVDPWWWGVPMRPQKALGRTSLSVTCAEIPWLLSRRYFGKAARTNLLINPDFETALIGGDWSAVGVTASLGSQRILGDYSVELDQATAGTDTFVRQQITRTASGIGDIISVAAWFYIEPSAWIGPAYGNRGLHIERVAGGVVQQTADFKIDDQTPRGVWTRAEIPLDQSVWMPPNATETLDVRLYAPGGTIYWDAAFVGLMESTSSAQPLGSDLTTLASLIVSHAQDPAFDKDDLDIGVVGSATGLLLARAWQHAEHANIWTNGIQELVALENGIDIGWDYTAGGRNLHVYSRVGAATGQGVHHTMGDDAGFWDVISDFDDASELIWGVQESDSHWLLDYGFVKDGGQAASSTTVLGNGDGPDREEGGYIDVAGFGGRIFEALVTAPNNARIDSLHERSQKAGAVRSRPVLIDVAIKPGQLIEGAQRLDLGDRFYGQFNMHVPAGYWRVMDIALNPQTDHMTVGLNPYV